MRLNRSMDNLAMPTGDDMRPRTCKIRLGLLAPLLAGLACGNLFDSNRSRGCEGAQCSPVECSVDGGAWPADWASLEDDVLVLVNQIRLNGASCATVRYGPAPALTMNPELRQAARCHSLDMATQNYFAHDSMDGRSPWMRMANAGYRGFPTAENIAAGYPDARSAVDGWMSSPGHCGNIMEPSSNETGIGYAPASSGTYRTYWTHDFGRR